MKEERAVKFDAVPERSSRFPGDRRVNNQGVYLPFNQDAPMGALPGDPTYPNIIQPDPIPEEGADVPTEQPVS